jgi:hypothetical protein
LLMHRVFIYFPLFFSLISCAKHRAKTNKMALNQERD